MPVKSDKQRRFMYASLAGKTDVPPSVAKKFVGPEAHKESEMKKPMPAFLMKKDAKKPAKKMASGGGIRGAKTVTKTGTPEEEFSPNYRTPVRAPKLYADGGYTRAADGAAKHGKTKGTIVKMMGGGKC